MKVQSHKIQGIPGKPKICHNVHDAFLSTYNKVVKDSSHYDFEMKVSVNHLSNRTFPLSFKVSANALHVVDVRVEVTEQESQDRWEPSRDKVQKWIDSLFRKEENKRAFLEVFEMIPKVKRIDWWESGSSIVLEAFNKTEDRSVLFCVDEVRGKSGVTMRISFWHKGGTNPGMRKPIQISEIPGSKEKKRNRRNIKKCFETHLKDKSPEETESFVSFVGDWRREVNGIKDGKMKSIQDVKKMIKEKGSFVLYLTAVWCKPCKAFGPVFETFSQKRPEVAWYKCDVSENEGIEYAKSIGSRSIPAIIMVVNGNIREVVPANLESLSYAYETIQDAKTIEEGDGIVLDGEF